MVWKRDPKWLTHSPTVLPSPKHGDRLTHHLAPSTRSSVVAALAARQRQSIQQTSRNFTIVELVSNESPFASQVLAAPRGAELPRKFETTAESQRKLPQ
jgi:hypothetical protein